MFVFKDCPMYCLIIIATSMLISARTKSVYRLNDFLFGHIDTPDNIFTKSKLIKNNVKKNVYIMV